MITDRDHLERILLDTTTLLNRLSMRWLAEDVDSCAPRSAGDGGRSSSTASDPTSSIVSTPGRTRHRDAIGSKLLHVHRTLSDLSAELTSRSPTEECVCCRTEPATHGFNDRGAPTRCWACARYVSRTGYPCDPDIHDGRGVSARMCDCPSWCCDQDEHGHTSCTDKAAEGRSVSERCKRRMTRARGAA